MSSTGLTGSSVAPADDEAAVRAAIDCYWATIVEANDPPDPDHPGFARCFTGPALERSQQITVGYIHEGQRTTDPSGGTEQFDVSVRVLEPDRVEVAECIVDDGRLIDIASGEVLNDRVVTARVQLSVVRIDGHWQVEDSISRQVREGRQPCAGL